MGRLIDADALIEKLKRTSVFECVRNSADKNIFEIIEEQPTAYSVDAVVEELENAYPINPYPNDFSNGRDMAIKNAIGIVRKGGVE